MIKLMDLLLEKISFRQLLDKSDPKRIARADDVSTKSLGVRGTNSGEAWNFSYKSIGGKSTTNQRHRGYIKFENEDIEKYNNLLDAPCIAECSCPDFRYKFSYGLNKLGVSPIGSTALNKSDGQRPKNYNESNIGFCKHLINLAEYLNTSIESPKEPEPINTTQPTNTKQSLVPIKKEPVINPTSVAPTPEDSHSLEPKIKEPIIKKEIPPQKNNKKELPVQKNKLKPQINPDKIGDTYSEEEPTKLKETIGNNLSQKFDLFVKSHPQFEIKYND